MYLSARIARPRSPVAVRRRPVATSDSIPSPVLGWNARDPWDGMKDGFAIILDNWYPQTGYVEARRGHAEHATGLGTGVVETLFEYISGSTRKFIAAANLNIYDATSAGAASSLASGFTNNRWQTANMGGFGLFVNGADTPQKYDGATIAANTWTGTGLTATNLVGIHVFKNRAYLIENSTGHFWYGGLLEIQGTLTKFPLSSVYSAGGNLIAIGTLTHDGGTGPDDLICFLMSTGTVIVYSGADPGDPNDWSLVGIFNVGAPIGRRPLVRIGSDLIVVTADGYIPLLSFLRLDRSQNQLAISDNIRGAVNEAVRANGSYYGWQPVFYPKGSYVLINVPLVESSQFNQHVMNTTTGAWCRFKGMNAVCWALFNDNLYFGGIDGTVYKADTGLNDDGSNIQADGQTAFKYFGGRGRLKRFTMYRPILGSEESLPVSLGLGVDFATDIPTFMASSITSEGATWDVATWDLADWASGVVIRKGWQSANNEGYSASIRVRTDTGNQIVRWYSNDITFETGLGYIG